MARSDKKIEKDAIDKIALFADIDARAVIPAPTIKSIYEVPVNFEKKHHISEIIFNSLDMPKRKAKLDDWERLVNKIKSNHKKKLKIALVGKYNENLDAYISVVEALKSACYYNNVNLDLVWISSAKLEKKNHFLPKLRMIRRVK